MRPNDILMTGETAGGYYGPTDNISVMSKFITKRGALEQVIYLQKPVKKFSHMIPAV
jgi:hypothetical protein